MRKTESEFFFAHFALVLRFLCSQDLYSIAIDLLSNFIV
jgi:hypothetical protein